MNDNKGGKKGHFGHIERKTWPQKNIKIGEGNRCGPKEVGKDGRP